jgi:hypothetical protein
VHFDGDRDLGIAAQQLPHTRQVVHLTVCQLRLQSPASAPQTQVHHASTLAVRIEASYSAGNSQTRRGGFADNTRIPKERTQRNRGKRGRSRQGRSTRSRRYEPRWARTRAGAACRCAAGSRRTEAIDPRAAAPRRCQRRE